MTHEECAARAAAIVISLMTSADVRQVGGPPKGYHRPAEGITYVYIGCIRSPGVQEIIDRAAALGLRYAISGDRWEHDGGPDGPTVQIVVPDAWNDPRR